MANQRVEIGWNASLLPTAHSPTMKKAYVAMPATSNAAATGMVPSGSGVRDRSGSDTRGACYGVDRPGTGHAVELVSVGKMTK